MGNIVFNQATKFLQKRRNTRRWIAVVLCLALVITSGTFSALTRHGSALTGKGQILACTYEGHVHGEECYNEAGELVCGYADYCVHEHNEDCYDSEGNLVCQLPEIGAHVHDDSCYAEEEQLICGLEENEIHQHTDDCYDVEPEDLVCELEEHVHDDSCYELITEGEEIPENSTEVSGAEDEAADGSEAPVQSEAPAGNEDAAQSGEPAGNEDAAQGEETVGNEDSAQSEEPVADDDNVQDAESVGNEDAIQGEIPSDNENAAQNEEPVQSADSSDNTAAQNEEAAEGTEAVQSEAPVESAETEQSETPAENAEPAGEINECAESRRLVCELEEHVHGNECYSQNKVLKCGKMESAEAHVHSTECYEVKQAAKCGQLELHTHSEECYTDGVLTCGKPELVEHIHSEDCFKEAPVMELTATAGDVTITVSAEEEGIIPAGAELSVTTVVKTETENLDNLESEEERAEAEALNAVYDEIQQGLEATVEEDETKEIRHFLAYDISFHTQNENGEAEEVKLNGDVNVTLEFPQGALPEDIISDENAQIDSVDVLDMKETEEGRIAEAQDAVVDTTQDADVEKVETTLSDSSTIAIAWIGEINPETGAYVYEDDDVVITVTPLAEDALPENAKLQVIPIIASEETGEQYQQVAERLMEKAENEEYAMAGFLAYDISFVDEEGNEIEPDGEVKVTMNYKEAKIPAEVDGATYAFASEEASEEGTASEAELNVKVMHLEEDGEGGVNVVDMAEQNKVTALETTEEQKIQNAEFVTEGFSIFTITWTWDPSTPYVYEDDEVRITVTAVDKDAIPEGTTLSITPVRADDPETAERYQEVAKKLLEKAIEEGYDITGFLAYDISLIGKDSMEIEPNGKVKVTMEYKQPMAMVEIDPETYALVSREIEVSEEGTANAEIPASEDGIDETEQAAGEADVVEDGFVPGTQQIDVTIMHLEEDNQGDVKQVVDMQEAGQVQMLEKTEQQEVCKTEFVTDSFSMFVLSWQNKGIQFKPGTGENMDVPSVMDQIILPENKNAWQIVKERYEGNGTQNKVSLDDVRYQKNVIPTDVENEFLVYLSIDMKSVFESYFSMADYKATTSNSYHANQVGDIVSGMTGNQSVNVSAETKYGKSAFFTIYDSQGHVVAENMQLYWSQGNNITFYLETSSGKYVLMGVEISSGSKKIIRLTKEAEDAIRQDITTKVTLGTLEDIMGEYIEFQGVVAGDYSKDKEPSFTNGVLTWSPVPKENAAVEEARETVNGTTRKTTWSLNVAELVYKVRLMVEKDNFHSCADNMDSTEKEQESYAVNKSAVLTYNEGKSITFPQPYVRGLLYDLTLLKKAQDENGKDLGVLKDAVFEVKDATGKLYGTARSDEKGIVNFTKLPWGTYSVTETEAPEGYKAAESAVGPIPLCYTTNSTVLVKNSSNPADMIHQDYMKSEENAGQESDAKNVVYNERIYTSVLVVKEWTDQDNSLNTRPTQIEVTLQSREEGSEAEWKDFTDLNHETAKYMISEQGGKWELVIEKLPVKREYRVVETTVTGYTAFYEVSDSVSEESTSGETLSSEPIKLTIRNILQSQIIKRSSSNPDLTLPGAEFELTGENVKWTGISGTDGTVEWKSESKVACLEMLADGKYSLRETAAPNGYTCSEAVWTIEVKAGMVSSVFIGNDMEKAVVNSGKQTFYFANELVYALPSTGGEGIYWYSIGGTLLMMAGALILYRNKNKRVRGCRRA